MVGGLRVGWAAEQEKAKREAVEKKARREAEVSVYHINTMHKTTGTGM
jgi:hypothetical protein